MINHRNVSVLLKGEFTALVVGAFVFLASCKSQDSAPPAEQSLKADQSSAESSVEWDAPDISLLHHQDGKAVPFQAGEISYLGQRAKDSSLLLTASNGFFDKGTVKALGKHASRAHEKSLISSEFRSLTFRENGASRWYVWLNNVGECSVHIPFQKASGTTWQLRVGNEMQEFVIEKEDEQVTRIFKIRPELRGKVQVELRLTKGKKGSSVSEIKMEGSALKDAAILRTRWRPSAIHVRYSSSKVAEPTMWIFESKSTCDYSSYSPITTRFGYFGGLFNTKRKASGGINFSMWAANARSKKAPALNQMPHLIATGNADAEFSGFGHEGSGVKIRKWQPLAHQPDSIVQALRVEKLPNNSSRYYGYLYHHLEKRWILYAVGQKVNKRHGQYSLTAGSFCEVPGPPAVERTGDRERSIKRRGWLGTSLVNLKPVDTETCKAANKNQRIYTQKDGWLHCSTGGLEIYKGSAKVMTENHATPEYLTPDKLKQLYELPVTFGENIVTASSQNSVELELNLTDAGTHATATLYYGEYDALTFRKRKLHGTEKKGLSSTLLDDGRVWQHHTPTIAVKTGGNNVTINNLKPGTQYFYRLLIKNDEGKSWAFESSEFSTKKE